MRVLSSPLLLPRLWALSSPAQRRIRVLFSYISSDAAHAWLMDLAAFTRSINSLLQEITARLVSLVIRNSLLSLPCQLGGSPMVMQSCFLDNPATSVQVSSRVVTGKDSLKKIDEFSGRYDSPFLLKKIFIM